MALVLEIISYRGSPPINPLIARFNENGGSVGRSFDNHLALPDDEKIISRHHGDIRYENGAYVYGDVSTGGTLLCNEGRLLEKGNSVTLADGDLLKIGEYEVRVRIESIPHASPETFPNLDQQPFIDHSAPNAFDFDIQPLFNDREPMPAFQQDVAPLQPDATGDFFSQADAPPFQENFAPPNVQSIPDNFSFDEILKDGLVPSTAPVVKSDGLDFPDDWFGDLGLDPVKQDTGSSPIIGNPTISNLPSATQEDVFPEIQSFNPMPVESAGSRDALESTPFSFDLGDDSGSAGPLFGGNKQTDQTPLFGNDSVPKPAGFPTEFEVEVKDVATPPIFEPSAPTVIYIPKPGRQIPPSRVTAVTSASANAKASIVQEPASTPVTQPTENSVTVDLFQCFLNGSGLTEFPKMSLDEQANVMTALGEVYREMVEGMMMILRARTKEKSEIRADRTVINREKNNPLKILPLAEDAMKIMIMRKHPSYIDATVAVNEGFTDIMKHQMAMRAGIQAALGETLKRFEPLGFEKRFDEGIVFQKKAKCWDAYSKAYPGLVVEAMENLFGDTFAKAYEEQMRMLRD